MSGGQPRRQRSSAPARIASARRLESRQWRAAAVAARDRAGNATLKRAADALLLRQLVAGQHTLQLSEARMRASALGALDSWSVRRGYGDPQRTPGQAQPR